MFLIHWLIIGLLMRHSFQYLFERLFATKFRIFIGMLLINSIPGISQQPLYLSAAVIMLKGLSPGAALVLLMAGPKHKAIRANLNVETSVRGI